MRPNARFPGTRPRSVRQSPPRRATTSAIFGAFIAATAFLSACSVPLFMREKSIEIAATDIRAMRLWQPELPISARSESLVAETREDEPEVARWAASAALRASETARRVDVAQAPFLVGSAYGRTFLRAEPRGRALAIGAPAASCPAVGLATGEASNRAAGVVALQRCFEGLVSIPSLSPTDERARCGCRLIAVGGALLAEPEAFRRAAGVSAVIVDAQSGAIIELSAQTRTRPSDLSASAAEDADQLEATLSGAASEDLFAASGAVANITFSVDGRATMALGEAVYQGKWRAEGFRRGRLARIASLSSRSGKKVVVLVGYEPAERSTRFQRLLAAAQAL